MFLTIHFYIVQESLFRFMTSDCHDSNNGRAVPVFVSGKTPAACMALHQLPFHKLLSNHFIFPRNFLLKYFL